MTTKTKPTTLTAIAHAMRTRIQNGPRPWTTTTLSAGLHIVLENRDDHWRLALARTTAYPSPTEIAICKAAFGVPPAAEPDHRTLTKPGPKTGQPVTHHIVDLHWIERQPVQP